MDTEEFKSFYKHPNKESEYTFYVEGLQCASCIHLLEKIPEFRNDITSVDVNFGLSILKVNVTTDFKISQFLELLEELGYKGAPLSENENLTDKYKAENRTNLKRIAVAGACAGNIMKPDISIPCFGANAVYDLAFNDSQKLLYASGNGFVGSFDVSLYNCNVNAFTLNVASSCGTLSATATISPVPPPGSTISYVLFSGPTQIAANTTGIFNGLSPNITYSITATVNQICSGSVTNTTFALPGPAVSPAITHPACGTSTGSIIVTAAGGTSPYTYSIDGVTFQPGNSFLNLVAGLYTVTVKDVNNCSNMMQVTILNANGPTATYSKTDATCGSNTGTITILNASIASGNKLSKYGFKQAGGHPFNYREYVIAFNKHMKAADLAKFESNGLIQTLKAQTESLRVQYLEKVEGWAKREFAGYEKLAASPSPNYADFATPGFVKGSGYDSIDYMQGKNYRKVAMFDMPQRRSLKAPERMRSSN